MHTHIDRLLTNTHPHILMSRHMHTHTHTHTHTGQRIPEAWKLAGIQQCASAQPSSRFPLRLCQHTFPYTLPIARCPLLQSAVVLSVCRLQTQTPAQQETDRQAHLKTLAMLPIPSENSGGTIKTNRRYCFLMKGTPFETIFCNNAGLLSTCGVRTRRLKLATVEVLESAKEDANLQQHPEMK